MYSTINQFDYSYNREFQRMKYLSEEPTTDDAAQKVPTEMLADLGCPEKSLGHNRTVVKKSPHFKYL